MLLVEFAQHLSLFRFTVSVRRIQWLLNIETIMIDQWYFFPYWQSLLSLSEPAVCRR